MRRAALCLSLTALLAGCGHERTPAPDLARPAEPRGERVVDLEVEGIRFVAPENWSYLPLRGQMSAGLQSGTATLAVWRYPRSEPLPRGAGELQAARRRLEARVRERDPTFELRSSRVTRRGGADAIELTGRQTIAGTRFGVRSAHVFKAGAEVVIDAYARPADFERVDAGVFRPVLASLRLRVP